MYSIGVLFFIQYHITSMFVKKQDRKRKGREGRKGGNVSRQTTVCTLKELHNNLRYRRPKLKSARCLDIQNYLPQTKKYSSCFLTNKSQSLFEKYFVLHILETTIARGRRRCWQHLILYLVLQKYKFWIQSAPRKCNHWKNLLFWFGLFTFMIMYLET